MIVLPVEQGSPEWLYARLGLPSCSQFDRILTPRKRQYAAAARGYLYELVAEWLLGYPMDHGSTQYMQRGTDMETEARAWYEMQRDVDVTRVGLVLRDDKLVAGSPDGLVGEDGGVEIKVPAAHTHVGYLLGDEPDYVGQIQGYMYLTGRRWWDFCSYSPALPSVLVRIERDDEYIAALEGALHLFLDDLAEAKDKLAAYRKESILLHAAGGELLASVEAGV